MPETSPLAIIAAGGRLPQLIAERLTASGRAVFLVLLKGLADPALEAYPHVWSGIGQFGRTLTAFEKAGCRDLVMVGALVRPNMRHTLPDWKAITTIPALIQLYKGGDDHLLRGIGALFEREGFRLRAVQDVMPDLLCPSGPLTHSQPTPSEAADIATGFAALDAIGPFDVGQGLILADRRIVAIEGAEGTDGLLARMAEMRGNGRIPWSGARGILVKAAKPGQDRRLDLPAIGPHTVEGAVKAGLRGIAAAAGGTLLLDAQVMVEQAEKAGIFIVGVGADA